MSTRVTGTIATLLSYNIKLHPNALCPVAWPEHQAWGQMAGGWGRERRQHACPVDPSGISIAGIPSSYGAGAGVHVSSGAEICRAGCCSDWWRHTAAVRCPNSWFVPERCGCVCSIQWRSNALCLGGEAARSSAPAKVSLFIPTPPHGLICGGRQPRVGGGVSEVRPSPVKPAASARR